MPRAISIALALLLGGCCCLCPVTVRPPAGGVVVDASTGAPIAHAVIDAESVRVIPGARSPGNVARIEATETDLAGNWYLGPVVNSGCIFPVAAFNPEYLTRYRIHAPGYLPALFDPWDPHRPLDPGQPEAPSPVFPPARLELVPIHVAMDPLIARMLAARLGP